MELEFRGTKLKYEDGKLFRLYRNVYWRECSNNLTAKGYKDGGRVKKMGGGMMKKRSMLKAGSNGNGKKKAFGMLSVKAGIDKNPMPTQADRIAGAKMKNKKGKA